MCVYVSMHFPLYLGNAGFNFDDEELDFARYIIMFVSVGYYGWMCSEGSIWVVVAVAEG